METKSSPSITTLDRRIRELCFRAAAAQDDAEAQRLLTELRSALRDHAARLKMILARYPVPSDRLVESRVPLRSSPQSPTNSKDLSGWDLIQGKSAKGPSRKVS
jgi:hypothetical protein